MISLVVDPEGRRLPVALAVHTLRSSSARSFGSMPNVSKPEMIVTVFLPARVFIAIVMGWTLPFLQQGA